MDRWPPGADDPRNPRGARRIRRTGLQLGLAAVTEANSGDIAVKLKSNHSRSTDEVISRLRARIAKEEPRMDVEFTQILQDMIGDLLNSPEPVQIKLFSTDAATLQDWAPRVATAIEKIDGVVDLKDGIENTVSGPATIFQVNPTAGGARRIYPRGVATDSTAILEGEAGCNACNRE